jgi:two-component system chemotaxis sensor kinase CheA
MSEYKIVCVDDEKELLENYQGIFEVLGHDVITFDQPHAALEYILLNQKSICLVVSDLKMPELDGMELRSKLLEENCEVPFVIVTGFFDVKLAEQAMSLRIVKFIEKPLKLNEHEEFLNKEIAARIDVIEEEAGMAAAFLEETTPMLEEIEELILTLEEDPSNQQALNTYFRLLHTIKGTSACLGLVEISKFSHVYEDYITAVKDGKKAVNNQSIDILLKGLDFLKKMYQCTSDGVAFPFNVEEAGKVFLQESSEPEEKVEAKEISGTSSDADKNQSQEKKEKDEKLNVSIGMLEEFMEQSGELTVLKNTIFKNLSKLNMKYNGDRELEIVNEAMDEMHKVSSFLQNQISEIKKVSIDGVFRPMKRVVRDSARNCNKNVDFHTKGEEIRVDTSLGKVLSNVLVHMLRNSVDHGVEAVEDRVKAGKGEKGNIWLSVKEVGEDIVVEIKDDGKGINPEVIKKLAFEKGLYSQEELGEMSDNRVFHIIFEPGFSTAEKVTEISGRGVGMDMVRSSIEESGGSIHIDSIMGEGTTFTMIIPIPRSIQIINSLMVDVEDHVFSIPLDNVAEVVLYEEGKKNGQRIDYVNNKKVLRHQNGLIPLVEAREIFSLGHRDDNDSMNIVVIRDKKASYGIIVDQINDIEEIIVKKLHPLLGDCEEYLGSTFVGDGNLSLILDVNGIAKRNSIEAVSEKEYENIKSEESEAKNYTEYMKFRLSNNQLFALPLDSVYRFEVIDPKSVSFTGDLPIVRYRESTLTIVFLENALNFDSTPTTEILSQNDQLDLIVVQKDDRWFGLRVNELLDIGKTNEQVDENNSDREEILGVTFIDDEIVSILNIDSVINPSRSNNEVNNGQLSINLNDYQKAS